MHLHKIHYRAEQHAVNQIAHRTADHHQAGDGERARDTSSTPVLKEAVKQLDRYFARKLKRFDLPLAAPSANRSMGVSPTTAAHVAGSLTEGLAAILDGGVCQQGLESTIVALREGGQWSLLREGPVTSAELSEVLGSPPVELTKGIEAPGQLVRHYSPGKPVRLGAAAAQEGEFLIGFGALAGQCNLSPTGDLAEAAARLYACLHEAAASDCARIAVANVPGEGIGAAINDRLQRAAA